MSRRAVERPLALYTWAHALERWEQIVAAGVGLTEREAALTQLALFEQEVELAPAGPGPRTKPAWAALCDAIERRVREGRTEAELAQVHAEDLASYDWTLEQIEEALADRADLRCAWEDQALKVYRDPAGGQVAWERHKTELDRWRWVAEDLSEGRGLPAQAETGWPAELENGATVLVDQVTGEELETVAAARREEGLSEKQGKLIRLQQNNAGAEGEHGDLPASEDTASSEAPAPSSATPPGEAPAEDLEEFAPDHDPGPAHEPEAGNPGGAGEDPGWDDEVLGIALGQTPAQEPQAVARGSQAPVNQEPDVAGAGERAARETLRLAIEEERATLRERAAGLLDAQQRERALRAIDAADTVEQLELTGKRLQASLRSQAAASAPAAPPPEPEPAPEPPAAPAPPELPFGESTWEVIYKEAARRGWEGSPGCCSCLRPVAFNDLAKEAWVGGAHLVAHDTCLEKEVRRAREERNKPPPGPGCSTCGAAQPAAHVRHEGACWDACRLCLTRRATVRAGREATAVCETCRADKRFRRIKVWTPIVEPAVTPAEAAAELGEIPAEAAPVRGGLHAFLERHGPDL